MSREAVVDASLLLSLGGASALSLLWDDPEHTWHITPITRAEVKSDPTRSEISRAILNGQLATTEIDTDSDEEIRLFARWSDAVDPGEAEAIAVAVCRGWIVGIEDLFAQRQVTREVGTDRWINAAALLLAAVRQSRKSLAEADAIFVRLDCYGGYRKRGIRSLRDLVTGEG